MKKLILIIGILGGLALGLRAQGYSDAQMSVNYNIGIPIGDFGDYIDQASFRGMSIQVDYFLTDQFSIGGYFGWNGYYQKKDRESYHFDRGALNGVRYNYLYQLPLYVKAQYLFTDDAQLTPYIAYAAGVHYIEQETYIGYVGFADEYWKFGMAPELGVLMMMGQSGWQFKAAGTYHVTIYDENNISTIQNIGINLGFNYDF